MDRTNENEGFMDLVTELRFMVKCREWKRVVEIFKDHPEVQETRINKWGDTALHAAIEKSSEETIKQMIHAIKEPQRHNVLKILSLENDIGNTPLHCAASFGSPLICVHIISVDISLIGKRNKEGETPLFLAALHNHPATFLVLHGAAGEDSSLYWRRNNSDTMLHCTISRENFELSLMIIHICRGISFLNNEKGESPLAILAATPSAFISGIHLNWWERLFLRLQKLEIPTTEGEKEFSIIEVGDTETTHHGQKLMTKTSVVQKLVNCEAVFRLSKKIKRRLLGLEIMKQLVEGDSSYDVLVDTDLRDMMYGQDPTLRQVLTDSHFRQTVTEEAAQESWTALLSATKNGATELAREILKRKPFAIDDETGEKKNIVLVAIEARQSDILMEVMKHASWSEKRLKYAKDVKGNTALHLSAKCSVNPSISLSVIHLQWEVHWFEYVRDLMPAYFMNEVNHEGKTPWMIFEAEHRGMLEESDKWVKDMSGNYMVATTLISSVTFATCFQIPGGYDGQHGTPILGSSTAFDLFAITALVSFCFSLTSLAAFLAIYSSRNDQYRNYRRSLPFKLLVGFFSLFVSIVSMLISFCAAHVFELNPKHKSRSIPLYLSLTSIPLFFYSATQIPLWWDLLFGTLATVPFSRPFYVGQQQQADEKVVVEEVVEEEEEEHKFMLREAMRPTRQAKRPIRKITRRTRQI